MPKPDQEPTGVHEWEGEHFKASWRETDEAFQASITHGVETVLFTYTPKSKKVEVVFGEQAQQELQEPTESEYLPITIEGYPVGRIHITRRPGTTPSQSPIIQILPIEKRFSITI